MDEQKQQSKFKTPLLAGLILLVLCGGIGIGLYFGDNSGSRRNSRTDAEIEKIRSIPKPKAKPGNIAAKEERNALKGLNDEESNIEEDLAILNHVFREAMTVFHRLPTGTHEEIVRFLQGENSRNLSYIPQNSPLVDAKGHILDRWGTPFVFHVVSHRHIEVRSSGPDKLAWSDDDIINNPAEEQSETGIYGQHLSP